MADHDEELREMKEAVGRGQFRGLSGLWAAFVALCVFLALGGMLVYGLELLFEHYGFVGLAADITVYLAALPAVPLGIMVYRSLLPQDQRAAYEDDVM